LFQRIRLVIAPLSLPGLGAAGIFAFISAWGDFLMPLILLSSSELQMLPLGLFRAFLRVQQIDYGFLSALAVLYMLPAVHAANAQKRVKIVSFNVTPAVMQAMAKSDVVAADCGTDPIRLGWACADQLLRVMSGVQPVPDIKLPIKLFTRDNVGGLDLSNISPAWFGPVDYRSEYKKLWGVK